MSLFKIRTIVEKEFDEIMKNRTILSTIIIMPLIFAVILPVAMLAPVFLSGSNGLTDNETARYIGMLPGVDPSDPQAALFKYFVTAVLPFFMMLPALLPAIISSYSVIGEKKNRTLEPLLAAPVSVYDIIIGKALSALIPALAATWLAAVIYLGISSGLSYMFLGRIILPDLTIWAVGMAIFAPLIAFLGIMLTVMISARVNDPRVAQQISALLIIPIMGLFIMQMSGLAMIDMKIMLALIVIVFVVDVISIRLGKFIFDREEILTRWK
jgi:ABC-2 type transport system permease protein